ncbi:hypothetical protein [Thaumasiovibrio subtropicus]|uniref:hypothetical protein n=1 Tax=Thaumasiovibrio subtropicus TaxID=1891207 RepID=UPI000B35D494|nr:hypothetical protein [Thaumasiovibrio subtropicus]
MDLLRDVLKGQSAKVFFSVFMALIFANPALASGLASGTSELTAFKDWVWTLTGIFVFLFIIVQAVRAMMDQITWLEFALSIVKVVVVGGCITVVTWAMGVFGVAP